MRLMKISPKNVEIILKQHDDDGGNQINEGLTKLFDSLNDEGNKYEVSIKVAALNQIYSTAIQYIKPVVEKIVECIDSSHSNLNLDQYSDLVDKIATVSWISTSTSKHHTRFNLSFSSKYVHFLSGRELPIYDSYIWLLMVGYKSQANSGHFSFSPPKTYKEFFEQFLSFREEFNLENISSYDLDKFLWQYGKNLITGIMKEQDVTMGKAKTILKKSITSSCSEPG